MILIRIGMGVTPPPHIRYTTSDFCNKIKTPPDKGSEARASSRGSNSLIKEGLVVVSLTDVKQSYITCTYTLGNIHHSLTSFNILLYTIGM